ncbi:hypothetical protein LguiB_016323 [Lonicera macranthoides]
MDKCDPELKHLGFVVLCFVSPVCTAFTTSLVFLLTRFAIHIEMENCSRELKQLQFVRTITIKAVVCLSILYEYAKQSSGPLKSTVGTVERALTTVVGPVYEKFKDVPGDVLVFLDNKVDETTKKFDKNVPPLAKKVVSQSLSMVYKALQLAENLVQQAQVGGPNAAIHYAGALYKQSVLCQLAKLWYGINQIPLLHIVAQMALPTAAYLSEKYNRTIEDMITKGYTGFHHLPLFPIDEMAKAYKQVEPAKGDAATTYAVCETDMD